MDHLSFQRDGSRYPGALSPSSRRVFPQRSLYTLPEHEAESRTDLNLVQHSSSTLSGPGMGHKLHSLNMNNSPPTSATSQVHGPRASFLHDMKKPEKKIPQCRAYCWTIFASLALHLFNLAASIAVVALLAQALSLHHKLRHVRQFSGADSAWPKNLSLTGSIVLLSAAATSVVKSTTFLVVEVHQRVRPHSNMFLNVLTACSAVMVAIWVSACVFAEMNRQSNDDFATWACARSDAPFNQVVPYGAICNEEIVSSKLAVAIIVVDTVLAISSAIWVVLSKFRLAYS